MVRTAQGTALVPQLPEAIRSVNPNLPLTSLQSHAEVVERSLARTSFTMMVLGVAAVVALLLGTVGIYLPLQRVRICWTCGVYYDNIPIDDG